MSNPYFSKENSSSYHYNLFWWINFIDIYNIYSSPVNIFSKSVLCFKLFVDESFKLGSWVLETETLVWIDLFLKGFEICFLNSSEWKVSDLCNWFAFAFSQIFIQSRFIYFIFFETLLDCKGGRIPDSVFSVVLMVFFTNFSTAKSYSTVLTDSYLLAIS